MVVYICDRYTALGMVDFNRSHCGGYDTCDCTPLCKGKEDDRK